MRIRIRVDVQGQYWDGGVIVEVPELLQRAFEPLAVTESPLMAYATGGVLANSTEARTVYKIRQDAAEILSRQLTEHILREMKKHDTSEGYEL